MSDLAKRFRAETVSVSEFAVSGDGSTTDPWVGWETAFSNMSTVGDVYEFKPGSYTKTAVVALPVGVLGQLVISGYGATITLTSTAPRLFDIARTADYQTFKNVIIEGMTVDGNSIGGIHHVVLGSLINNSGTTGQRLNISNIMLRDITTQNVKVGTDTSVDFRHNIKLVSYHPTSGETQTSIQNVVVRNCTFNGGLYGTLIGGDGGDDATQSVNVFVDDLVLDHVKHIITPAPPAYIFSANYHLFFRGFGGKATVRDCYGEGSRDVGVETDAADNVLLDNTVIRDAFNSAFYHTTFSAPSNLEDSSIVYRKCRVERVNVTPTSTTSGLGFRVVKGSLSVARRLIYDNCSFFRTTAELLATSGEALSIAGTADPRYIMVRNFVWQAPNISINSGSLTFYALALRSSATSTIKPVIIVDGLLVRADGDATGATAALVGLLLNGGISGSEILFDINNMAADLGVTNVLNSCRGIDLGGGSGTNFLSGTVNGFRVVRLAAGGGNLPRGIMVRGQTNLTVTGRILIRDCDFQNMPSGNDVFFDSTGGSNASHTILDRNRWATYPTVSSVINPTASPYSYQNLDGYAEYVTVTGGTVTAIDYSLDNSTFRTTGQTAGIFRVEPADYLRVTFGNTATMTKTPVR